MERVTSMKRKICLLGITGSIGRSTIDILKEHEDEFELISCSGFSNLKALKECIRLIPSIKYIYFSSTYIEELKKEYPYIYFYSEHDGFDKFLSQANYDLIINALVGFIGLKPTLYAISHNIDIALANKESLVVAGELINDLLKKHPLSHLYPIDSEHVALLKCLKGRDLKDVHSLVLTASGGPFKDLSREQLKGVTLKDALHHPSWVMGDKITIDSATMVNKGLEIIEAYHLFHVKKDQIRVLLHDESYIHSLIEMKDGSYVVDIGPHDMKIPISYALFKNSYQRVNVKPLSLEDVATLHFRKLDEDRFPSLRLARYALDKLGSLPCVFNGANEEVNLAFREGRIEFYRIEEVIEMVMNKHQVKKDLSYDELAFIHHESRLRVKEIIGG